MLRGISASNGPVSAAPNPVREATAVAEAQLATVAPSSAAATETAVAGSGVAGELPTFRYNSSEFVYRQDIGRIVLIGQSPETGERTIQIPSEEALRAYERTMRSEERADLFKAPQAQAQSGSGVSQLSGTPGAFAPATPAPKQVALPSLSRAVSAVFDQGSAVVSLSA